MSSVQTLNLGEQREFEREHQIQGTDRRRRSFFDPTINVGTILHLVGVLVAMVVYGMQFDKRTSLLEAQVQEQGKTLERVERKLNRLEHYLSSKDLKYWQASKANGDDN